MTNSNKTSVILCTFLWVTGWIVGKVTARHNITPKTMVNTQRQDQNRRQAAASLSDVWTIPEPLWSYSERVFELRWSINNLIEDDQIEFRFYDQNCQDGNNELPLEGTGYTISQPIPSGPIGDGTGTREFEVTFTTIVPDIQDNTVIYTATGANTARTDLCVRLGLSTPSSALSQEVNWAESIMRLQYDFEGGFSFRNITVVPPELTISEASVGVSLRAKDCTDYGEAAGPLPGSVVRLCIEPVPSAVLAGYRMSAVPHFKFARPDSNYTQWTVRDSVAVEPFSQLFCIPGEIQCVIEVFLLAGFYTSSGTIEAVGEAVMQLGTAQPQQGRRSIMRNLQATSTDSAPKDENTPAVVTQDIIVPIQVSQATEEQQAQGQEMEGMWQNGQDASRAANIGILVLIVLNAMAFLTLAAQHPRCKGSKFYLS